VNAEIVTVMQSNNNNKKIVTAALIEIQFFGRYGIKKVRAPLLNEEKLDFYPCYITNF